MRGDDPVDLLNVSNAIISVDPWGPSFRDMGPPGGPKGISLEIGRAPPPTLSRKRYTPR
jgi:hypothetical protein